MNWKEHANLFANGKFEVRSELPSMPVGDVECILHGYVNGQYRLQFSGIFDWVDVADCQLIARPIEDMTDWESKEYMSLREERYSYDFDRGEKVADGYCETTESFLYLLSIGAYPFSDTEDVIFKPKQEDV